MAIPSWISTSSVDHNTGANWSTGTSPANGDSVSFDNVGTANCTTNMTQGGETYAAVNVGANYAGQIGTSGSPYTPDAITILNYKGAGTAFIAGAVASIYVDSPNANPTGLTLTCTGIALMDVVRGGVTISGSGTTASNGRINIGGTGNVTLNGAAMSSGTEIIVQDQGVLTIYVNIINLTMNGGEVWLGTKTTTGTATSTAIQVAAGTLHVYGSGTQTLIEGRGTGRIIVENDVARTWTTTRLFDGNVMLDISKTSATNFARTNGIKVLGANAQPKIIWPSGATLTQA